MLPHADRPVHIAVSAGGDAAAFVIGRGPGGAGPATGLWYGRLDGSPARIGDLVPDTNLAFAPEGSAAGGAGVCGTVALAVQGDKGSDVIVADPAADQGSWRRCHVPAFAERLAWTRDGLIVLAADPGADAASLTSGKPLAGEAEDPVVARAAAGWRRLWAVDPAAGTALPVSPPDLAIWEFAPVPGGGTVVVASDDPTEAGWYHSSLVLLGAGGDRARVLHRSDWQLSSPAVSPDGATIACIEGWASDRGLLAGEVRLASLDDGAGVRPLGADLGADVTWLSWAADGRLWLAGWQHLGTAWGWVDGVDGASGAAGAGAGTAVVQAEAASCLNSPWHPEVVPLPDGSALTMRSTPSQPPEVVRLRRGADPAPWTALNGGLAEARTMQVRELRWPAADGTEIEALLALPASPEPAPSPEPPEVPTARAGEAGRSEPAAGGLRGAEPSGLGGPGGYPPGPIPLVADIHGGPSLAWHHSWDLTWAELLTGAGYAVLMANPRGSAGRGQPFGRANLGDPAGAEFADLVAGVAHCVDAGIADPGRVAAMGASYGGYLTAWAIAGGTVFRCGVVIAGMSDLVSVRGTANNAPFYDYLLQGRPADLPLRYLERSPVTRLGPASVPTLILHGEVDRCVPVSQAEELYAGLREFGVPAEFVTYPREGHQAREPAHVADQRERVLRWLATHLEAAS